MVEGDYSSAQYWFTAAAVTGSEVSVGGLNLDSEQGDKRLLDILKETGSEVRMDNGTITVHGGKSLKPFSVDGRDIPDLVPTLAVIAAVGNGVSEITNIGHLRGKESDRLAVPVEELGKMGIRVEIKGDALRIYGGQLKGAVINPHGDHRIAMAFAIAGLVAEGETIIQGAEVVSKSYPEFWDDLKKLGGNFSIN
jgi:3-phosphoshikimate 1-carboxyvinyltransferase